MDHHDRYLTYHTPQSCNHYQRDKVCTAVWYGLIIAQGLIQGRGADDPLPLAENNQIGPSQIP